MRRPGSFGRRVCRSVSPSFRHCSSPFRPFQSAGMKSLGRGVDQSRVYLDPPTFGVSWLDYSTLPH